MIWGLDARISSFEEERMFDIAREEIEWGGRTLTLETGRVARQADGGAVLPLMGKPACWPLLSAIRRNRAWIFIDRELPRKSLCAGKVPGGYFKREGRPSEKETLVSRLIDRPIRPLFVKGFKNETQIIATVVSHDLENDADIVAMAAVSAALTISDACRSKAASVRPASAILMANMC